jgi:hypothetical protein
MCVDKKHVCVPCNRKLHAFAIFTHSVSFRQTKISNNYSQVYYKRTQKVRRSILNTVSSLKAGAIFSSSSKRYLFVSAFGFRIAGNTY